MDSKRRSATSDPFEPLCDLCRAGRLFEVVAWIEAGKPLQSAEPAATQKQSPLRIAIERGNHSLVQVLLEGGYAPNLERQSPLTWALEEKRSDLVELLLDAGADPDQVELHAVFATYDSEVFERFYALGVDLAAGHELASELAYSSTNKPLYGFVRRHREESRRIADELQIGLNTSIEQRNERATAMCLWAGADPRREAPTLRFVDTIDDDDDEDGFRGWTALEHAAMVGDVQLLKRFRPSTDSDDLQRLHECARDPEMLDYLYGLAPPEDPMHWFAHQMLLASVGDGWRLVSLVERAFDLGVRLTGTDTDVGYVRRNLLKTDSGSFCRLLRLLCMGEHCDGEFLRALTKTAAFRRRMREEGFLPDQEKTDEYASYARQPVGRLEVQRRLGLVPKPPPAPLPSVIDVGWCRGGDRVSISRTALYEMVWTVPVREIAKAWGMSDRGLGKACARLQVPVPPRGYWAKKQAGQKVRRPRLPPLPGNHEPALRVPCVDVT